MIPQKVLQKYKYIVNKINRLALKVAKATQNKTLAPSLNRTPQTHIVVYSGIHRSIIIRHLKGTCGIKKICCTKHKF